MFTTEYVIGFEGGGTIHVFTTIGRYGKARRRAVYLFTTKGFQVSQTLIMEGGRMNNTFIRYFFRRVLKFGLLFYFSKSIFMYGFFFFWIN